MSDPRPEFDARRPADAHEAPSWADARLGFCGFTLRGSSAPSALACVTQVHGKTVHVVAGEPAPDEGDGLWTTTPGLLIAVRVADCTPILLWDPEAGAVAAVHAGWRGTAADIAGEAVRLGEQRLAVRAERLRAAIGPCISAARFEVGPEVVAGLLATGLGPQEIGLCIGPRDRPHVDLRRANRALLTRAGVRASHIEDVGGCSFDAPARYESYRRDGAGSGRMRGVIGLAGRAGSVGASSLLSLLTLLTLLVPLTAAGLGCGGVAEPESTSASTEPGAPPALSADDATALRAAVAIEAALDREQHDEADRLVRAELSQRPDSAWLRASLARALNGLGRHREAAVQGRLALGIDPSLWQASYNLACSHAALGEEDAAIRWLQPAVAAGALEPADVVGNPDLAPLLSDHRFVFYQSTGVLSRQEEDAIAVVQPSSLQVGETAVLTLVVVALNRPLMAAREAVSVRLAQPLPDDLLLPSSRRETFSTGAEGGREYMQRTFHFAFRPLRAGVLPLGPFEVKQGDSRRFTEPVFIEVREGSVGGSAPGPTSLATVPGLPTPLQFFQAPSAVDEALFDEHTARGGGEATLDPLADPEALPEAGAAPPPWASDGAVESRLFRYRATTVESLPSTLPPRDEPVFRSILVQRATEGWSHVLETRTSRAEGSEPLLAP